MFGHKKDHPEHFTPLTQQAGEEPVHIFDQTNGVLRHFDEVNQALAPNGSPHELAGPMAAASMTRIGR